MRRRERERVERLAHEVCADEAPQLAGRLLLIWARELPDAYGLASAFQPWVLICETRWRTSDSDERADTIAHELAHLITWCRDSSAPPHGPAWESCFRRLREVAIEMEW